MKGSIQWIKLTALMSFALLLIMACKDNPGLESIEVSPSSYTGDTGATVQFQAIGLYDDDSTEDLTSEVQWSDDSTTDSVLSTVIPGLAHFATSGSYVIYAVYSFTDSDGSGDSIADYASAVITDASVDAP